jgi:hypothetical protein
MYSHSLKKYCDTCIKKRKDNRNHQIRNAHKQERLEFYKKVAATLKERHGNKFFNAGDISDAMIANGAWTSTGGKGKGATIAVMLCHGLIYRFNKKWYKMDK